MEEAPKEAGLNFFFCVQITQMRTDYVAYEPVHVIRGEQCFVADLVQIHSSKYGSTT